MATRVLSEAEKRGLDAAFTRKQQGSANPTDLRNLEFAQSQGLYIPATNTRNITMPTPDQSQPLPLQPGEQQAMTNKFASSGYTPEAAAAKTRELWAGRPAASGEVPPPTLRFNPTGEDISTSAPSGQVQAAGVGAPDLNGSWQSAMTNLLRQYQSGGKGVDTNLLANRNALVQARFGAKTDITPEQLRVLSPEDQAAIRSGAVGGLNTQLTGANTALQSREKERDELRQLYEKAAERQSDSEKPVSVGGALINPRTGEVIYQAPAKPDEATEYQRTQIFNSLADKHNKSPLIAAADRVGVLTDTISRVRKNPSNGADQLALIYGYIQALDNYQSAVREGEISISQNIQSKAGQMQNYFEQISNGQILTAAAAKDMATGAEALVNSVKAGAAAKSRSFQSQANVAGVGDKWQQYISGSQSGYSGGNQQTDVGGSQDTQPTADNPLGLPGFKKDLSTSRNGSSAEAIAAAIKKTESNGNYNARGGSGEFGAYQFMPATWKSWAGQYLGNPNAPMTPQNQDTVAKAHIQSLIAKGYNAQQIALIWNGGQPIVKKGVNKYGVKYDSGAYARKVLENLG